MSQAEVEELDALARDKDVARLEIAVNDALGVRGLQRVQDLNGVLDGPGDRQRSLQRPAIDVLHDQVIGADIVERANMAMIEGGNGPGLALEPRRELLLAELDRDFSTKT